MTATLTVRGKIIGQKKPLLPAWELALPPAWQDAARPLLLRDLITRVVLEQVQAFQQRQAERKLLRILTPGEIAHEAARGKVSLGGSDLEQQLDPQAAVQTALQAFADRLYLVFIDEQQQTALDNEVHLCDNSQLTFVRLVPLAGG